MSTQEDFQAVLTDRYKDFSVDALCDLADALCQYDDPFRALKLLEHLPGHFRQWPPERVKKLREEIQKAIITPNGYLEGYHDTKGSYEDAMWAWRNLARARLVEEEVRLCNQKGITPHVVDQGPGHYWLPIGLLSQSYRFTYKPVGLDKPQFELSKPYMAESLKEPGDGAPVFYVAYEIIEHVMDTKELCYESLRSSPKTPAVVFLSTPNGCFDARTEPWRKRGMGHVRTYTPSEWVDECKRVFDYCDRWLFYTEGPILMAQGYAGETPWRQ